MFRRQLVIVLFLFLPVSLFAQQKSLVVRVRNTPLNKVLIHLRNQYNIHLSFDDNLLSQYKVSLHKTFKTPGEAIRELLKPFPLAFTRQGDIFVIWKKKSVAAKTSGKFYLEGYITDQKTGEPLAFSHVLSTEKNILTDVKGYFSEVVKRDTLYHFIISHLGYYVLDTVLAPGSVHVLRLIPSSIPLQEVEITGKTVDFVSQIGQRPGVIRFAKQPE